MPKKYKVSKLAASARRPSMRSPKRRHVKVKLTLLMLALVIAVMGVYAMVRYLRTDHEEGGVEVVVGSQLMAYISCDDVPGAVTVTDALEAVSVRPTSMQTVILAGPDINVALTPADLDVLYLISEEKHIALEDQNGSAMGTVERIYLPIDE